MDINGTVLARGGKVTVEGNVYRLLAPTSSVSLDSTKWVKTPVVTDFYQNKKAAMTIIMDDGYHKSGQIYDRIFKKYGLKGTANIISNKIENVGAWKEILAGGRIDVGNHSASHDIYYGSGESRQQLVADITDAYSALKGTFPDQNILAFAAPYGRNSAEATEVMKEKHFANRAAGSSSSNNPDPTENEWMNLGTFMYSNTKLETMNGWVDDALGGGKWGIELYHGILGVDNMSSDLGVDETLFDNHMSYLASKKNDIWNGTLNEVTAYIRERQNAVISTSLSEDGGNLTVLITDNLPNDKFFHPLTVKVYLPGGWGNSVNCSGSSLSAKTDEFGKYVMVDIVPDKGEVTISK
jgi:peptidoglycan/xylan/chitin deacetylase (PgdA/CDA1 family)